MIGLNFANLLDALCFLNLIKQFGWSGDPKQVAKEEEKLLGMNSGVTKPKFIGKKNHAGWNPLTQTFNLKEMPEQIKTLLRKSGIKKKALKNKVQALVIFKNLMMNMDLSTIAPVQQQQQEEEPKPFEVDENRIRAGSNQSNSLVTRIEPGLSHRL